MVIKDILGDEINEKGNYLRRGTRPRFADIEVIAFRFIYRSLDKMFAH